MADQPRWFWSQEFQQHYVYDAQSDSLFFRDGRRIARPASVPRSAFVSNPSYAGPSASSYNPNPVPTSPGYVTGPPGHQYWPQGSFPPPSGASSTFGSTRNAQSQLEQSRRTSSQVDSLAQNFASVTVSTKLPSPGPSQHPQPVTPQVTVGANGQRIVKATDPTTNIHTIYQTGPANAITDPALLQSGIHARSRLLPSDNEVYERLFKSFRLRDQPRKFFTIGKVFLVLWVEPAGESATQVTGLEVGTTIGRFGERAFSKVRRFVVVREGDNYCSALPITSYGKRGVGKPGVNKSEHSIIYTTKNAPDPLAAELPVRDELGMRPHAIRVDTDDPIDKLDNLSRLDYGKVHTIQHNIKVKAFGKVHPKSMNALLNQFGNVWNTIPSPGETGARSTGQTSSHGKEPLAGQRRPSQSGRAPSSGGGSAYMAAPAVRLPADADSNTNIEANVRTAIHKLIQQGYSPEQADQRIREQLARLQHDQAARRREALQEDDEESSDDSDDNDDTRHPTRDGHNRRQQEAYSHHSKSSSQAQQRGGAQQASSAEAASSITSGPQSAVRTPGESQSTSTRGSLPSQSQVRSAGGSSASYAHYSLQDRAQADALISKLLQEGKSREEAIAIIRARFDPNRRS